MVLNDNVYKVLKWLGLIVLPAIVVFERHHVTNFAIAITAPVTDAP